MRGIFIIVGVILQTLATHSLIIPDEVPSLLSVIYSNIPTIKKGTDSRFGWGFRLGNRADFQVLTELGPQTYTQPIRQIPNPNASSKRHVANNLRNILYAQQQYNRNKQISNTKGGKWIDEWSQSVINGQKPAEQVVKPDLGIGEIDAKSVIPDDATLMLQELYKRAVEGQKREKQKEEQQNKAGKQNKTEQEKEEKSTTVKPKTTTSAKDALDNVDIYEEK